MATEGCQALCCNTCAPRRRISRRPRCSLCAATKIARASIIAAARPIEGLALTTTTCSTIAHLVSDFDAVGKVFALAGEPAEKPRRSAAVA